MKRWRRGRDSNPRWACTHAAFRVRCIQPLCHLSCAFASGEQCLTAPLQPRKPIANRFKIDQDFFCCPILSDECSRIGLEHSW